MTTHDPVTRARAAIDEVLQLLDDAAEQDHHGLLVREVGRVAHVGEGVAEVTGLPNVGSEELLRFPGDTYGLAWNLDRDRVGAILLDPSDRIGAGDLVRRTGRVMDVPVGGGLVGRVVDALGRPLDGRGPLHVDRRLPVERPAPSIVDRAPVRRPLQTGITVVDALVPIGRGQRELVVGDRQTGKTQIGVDTILNQRDTGVICVYCAVGQRSSAVARVVDDLRTAGALGWTIVVAATAGDPPGQQFVAPYAATSMAEDLVEQGRDVLLVIDDLTRHARTYREISLLLRRPPGREAYPGDIFYVHSRLLERAAQLAEHRGGGSLTAMPIVETQAQTISAYIPTNLISITDGQIYVDPRRFHAGILPAVDVGRSVSRVGGVAQVPGYRSVAGRLRLAHAQFEDLERFSRYGARLESSRRRRLEHGRRVREVLKQPPATPYRVGDQVAVLAAATAGLLDHLPIELVPRAADAIRTAMRHRADDLARAIADGEEIGDEELRRIREIARTAVETVGVVGEVTDADA